MATTIAFYNWIKIGGNGDWWTFTRQPAPVLRNLFRVATLAAAQQQPGGDDGT